MGRKTIILTESQFNEICGANTAYLDNQSDYAKDGTIHMRTDGAAGNGEGDEYYSKPQTTDDIADSVAPETLFALLFRNGGNGLWGHWGSGLRADELEGFGKKFPDTDDEKEHEYVVSMNESNSELEGRKWNGNSYTNLTTKKTQYKQMLNQLVKNGAPEQQIKRVKAAYMGVCSILDRETNAIKQGKKNRKEYLGMANQFQKPGGSKNSGNGKAHTRKKQTDPNVGTGYITYA